MREQSPAIRGFVNQGQANATSPSIGIPTWVYVVIGLLVLTGLGFVGYKLLAPKIEEKKTDADSSDSKSSTSTTAASSAGLGASIGSQMNAVMTSSNVTPNNPFGWTTPNNPFANDIYFPLKKVSGEALKKSNPFVVDLQNWLNKSKAAKLTVDGAFGAATESALLKATGKKTMTKEQYNDIVAPALDKPLIF